jgi:amino acid transporter
MAVPTRDPGTGLRRNLSVWQAVGISVALMAPSMAANINPQGSAGLVGRATPLAFLLAGLAVLLIAYVFVRLCQYYRHAARSTSSPARRSARGSASSPAWG